MHNQQQRKTYYVKQTVKPCKTQQSIRKAPIKAEMLKKNKTQQTTFNGRKKYKTDINNEEKLAQKNTNQRQKETLKKHTNVTKQCEKQRHKNRNHAQKKR